MNSTPEMTKPGVARIVGVLVVSLALAMGAYFVVLEVFLGWALQGLDESGEPFPVVPAALFAAVVVVLVVAAIYWLVPTAVGTAPRQLGWARTALFTIGVFLGVPGASVPVMGVVMSMTGASIRWTCWRASLRSPPPPPSGSWRSTALRPADGELAPQAAASAAPSSIRRTSTALSSVRTR